MTSWAHLFLGVIAAATLAMAILQLCAVVYAGLIGRRVVRLLSQLEQELKPLSASLNAVGRDAARATALAAAQVERVDQLFANMSERVEQMGQALQKAAAIPAREGAALVVAVKAAVSAFRELRASRSAHPGRTEDGDALFIG